jgi:hypothetical protein
MYLAGEKNTDSWHARKGDLQRAFPLDVPMVLSLKLSSVDNGNHPTDIGLAPGSTIHFGSLEFTADHLGRLSLSPQEWDSSTIFIGMVHTGSPSLHTALKESSDEDGVALGAGGSSGSPDPRGCNVVTPTDPITATLAPKNTPTLQTIPTVTVWIVVPSQEWSSSSINNKLTRRNNKREPAFGRSTSSCGQLKTTMSLTASKHPLTPS